MSGRAFQTKEIGDGTRTIGFHRFIGTVDLLQSDSRRDTGELSEEDDAKFDELVELIVQRISRLKALHASWVEFCSGLGLVAGDIDTMIGVPFMGRLEQLEPIQEIALEVTPDEEYQQECLDVMWRFCKTKLEDRYPAPS